MTSDSVAVTLGEITAAATMIDLPLSESDANELVGLLGAWMPAAVALSARMQEVAELTPITTFAALSGTHVEEVS